MVRRWLCRLILWALAAKTDGENGWIPAANTGAADVPALPAPSAALFCEWLQGPVKAGQAGELDA